MKVCTEKVVRVGFKKDPKKIFDQVDSITASMIRDGWSLKECCLEDGLANIHLFFEREIDVSIEEEKQGGFHEV
ncbi:MAG: hypothetical protein ACM31E_01730 [Fibrobacterota bacterium]|nr:hypothetical protein [Chitinispirillaceae bacterium]